MGGTSCQHQVLWASLTKLIRMGQTGWGEGQRGRRGGCRSALCGVEVLEGATEAGPSTSEHPHRLFPTPRFLTLQTSANPLLEALKAPQTVPSYFSQLNCILM